MKNVYFWTLDYSRKNFQSGLRIIYLCLDEGLDWGMGEPDSSGECSVLDSRLRMKMNAIGKTS